MTTSAGWKSAFDSRMMGEQFVEVVIDCSDKDKLENATVTVLSGEETRYSVASSVVSSDDIDKVGTLESNLWVLDSSSVWGSANKTPGYISLSLSDDLCEFNNETSEVPHFIPSIKLTLNEVMDFDGFTIIWSELFGEWATDFSIEFLDSSSDTILLKEVTENKSIVYSALDAIEDCKYVVITVTKWCLPGRRARIERIYAGAQITFTKKDLLKFSFSKSESPINNELPCHIVDFTVHNYDGRYDADGSVALSNYLQKQNSVYLKYGITLTNGTVEYVSGGTYFLDTWCVDSTGMKISIKARDPFYFMTNQYANRSYTPNGESLATIATAVLQDAMQEYSCVSEWSLDYDLASITSVAYLQECTHAEALQLVAQAAGMVLSYDGEYIVIAPANYSQQSSQGEIKALNCFDYPKYEEKALPNSVNCKVYSLGTDMIHIGANHFPDISGDGFVNSIDAQIAWSAAVAIGTGQSTGLTPAQETKADADMDGVITSWDATLISRFSAGIGNGTYTNDLAGWTLFYNVTAGVKKVVADITMELIPNAESTVVIHHVSSYDVHVVCSENVTSMMSYTDETRVTLTPVVSTVHFKVYGYPINKSTHDYVRSIDSNSDNIITVDNQLVTSDEMAHDAIDSVVDWLGQQKSVSIGNFRIDPAFTTGMATVLNNPVYITDIKFQFSGMFKGSVSGKVIEVS